MIKDESNQPTNQPTNQQRQTSSVWRYNSDKGWWYHRHTKGIWPFRRKYYYVDTHRDGWCLKCGAKMPEDLKQKGLKENDRTKA